MRALSPCGTESAYRRHLRRHEEPCGPCRRANSEAAARRMRQPGNEKQAKERRAARNAQRKAERAARRLTDLDRLMRSVSKGSNGCWYWTGGISSANGYGRAWYKGDTITAHVAVFRASGGDIPDGYEIDHTCHNRDLACPGRRDCMHRRCVNPDHLEAVTASVNQIRQGARKTHCPQGHEYTPENTYIHKGTNCRSCRRCQAATQLANYHARKAAG